MPYPPPAVDDGAAALDDVAAFVGRHVVFPTEYALTAVALWAAHTHAAHRFYVSPRLVLDSAEPGSGKTRVLELLALLCSAPKLTVSTTTAALYRRIAAADAPLTVLMDEVDALFGPRPTPQAEDLRALINAGYKRGATVDRCVGEGKTLRVEEFPVFAPVALAGLAGRMPATITSRAVVIHMRRRGPGEHVEPFRERDAQWDAGPIRERVGYWIDAVAADLETARPVMPDGVVDRPAEVWEALLAVADAAGGEWPDRARAACRWFVLDAEQGEPSLGVRLLADLRQVLDGREQMPTNDIVEALRALDEAPWGDLYGKPLDARRLARELDRYGVRPEQYRDAAGMKQRGYTVAPSPRQAGLADAWARYLPSVAGTAGTSGTPQVTPRTGPHARTGRSGTPGTAGTAVPDDPVQPADPVRPLTSAVPAVPAVPPNCEQCGQRLLLDVPGRTRCERCEPGGMTR